MLNQSFPLEGEQRVGGEGADIAIDGLGDGAVFRVSEGRIDLTAAGGEAISVNGEMVSEASLGSGDEIRIGACRFIVQAPGLRPERVLVEEAVKPRRPVWPWVVAALLAAGAGAWYLYQQGMITL